MTSFHFDIGSRARFAGRFLGRVRSELLRALLEQKNQTGMSQQKLAQKLDVHRSLINRQLSGEANLTLRSLADLAFAMDMEMEISFELRKPTVDPGQNQLPETSTVKYGQMKFIDGGIRPIPLSSVSSSVSIPAAPVSAASISAASISVASISAVSAASLISSVDTVKSA